MSRVIASRVTRGTTTLSLLPSTKAVSGRRRVGGGGGGGGRGGREWPTSSSSPNTRHAYPAVRFSRSRLDEGGTTQDPRHARSYIIPTWEPAGRHRARDSSSSPPRLLPSDEDEERTRAGSRGRRASTSAQFFVLSSETSSLFRDRVARFVDLGDLWNVD